MLPRLHLQNEHIYSLTPVDELTRLFNAIVIGIESKSANEAPNKKSFHILVNCQIIVTTMMGPELGNKTRQKIRKKPAPSICAAFTISVGKAA